MGNTNEKEKHDTEEEDLLLLLLLQRRQKLRKRKWVHEINQRRQELGEYHRLIQELRQDPERFFTYFWMSCAQFDTLTQIISPHIKKLNTNYRRAITVEERLAVCLRFLATGDSFTTIAFSFRMGITTVGQIVDETCEVLWDALVEEYMPKPTTEKWSAISSKFFDLWHFPNCIGAIDGKHVVIQAPPNSGSMFFNYKGTFSIVLMALVDAEYAFIAVDIGSYGSNSDGGIFCDSQMGKGLEQGILNVPSIKVIQDAPEWGLLPHVVVGDPAFPLKPYLMRPFPGKKLKDDQVVFNYRLSRARRVSENAFGILTQRWRVFQRRLNVSVERAERVVKATCILHNFLQEDGASHPGERCADDLPSNDNTGAGLTDIPASMLSGNRTKQEAKKIRETFKDHFSSFDEDRYLNEHYNAGFVL